MAASKKAVGRPRKDSPQPGVAKSARGAAGETDGTKPVPVGPVKLGRKRTRPPEVADAAAAANARYQARLAGELPPVETAPLGTAYQEAAAAREKEWKFEFADAYCELHAAAAKATGIDELKVPKSKASDLEACVLGIMAQKGVEIPQENKNWIGLVILLIGIYLPIGIAVWTHVQKARETKPAALNAPRAAGAETVRPPPQPAAKPAPPPAAGGFWTEISEHPETDVQHLGGFMARGALIEEDPEE